MAAALEQSLGPRILREKQVTGWVNVPADCLIPTAAVTLHVGRPPGVNEPTEAGVTGVGHILRLVSGLGPRDLCLCLLSGGASALLPAPVEGFALADKLAITQEMSARGATIAQMNAVRRSLSAIKGGGLAEACRAGRLVSLIVSDVPGDDLSTIGSGPTIVSPPPTREAIEVLRLLSLLEFPAGARAKALLDRRLASESGSTDLRDRSITRHGCRLTNLVIGNNATAVDAAGVEAERLGYSHAMVSTNRAEGPAEEVAHQLVKMACRMREDANGPDCLISGGEPTVRLAPSDVRGKGGRNQQLCLASLAELSEWRGMALISGGTDGEDGPTNAAGACVDVAIADKGERLGLDPREHLARNDAYSFFEAAGGLLVTGPTHTNVCDLRVLTVSR
jgi:hydroxypyruvate reductase